MARPSATRWRWPPDSSRGLRAEERPELQDVGRLLHAPVDVRLGDVAQLQAEGQVVVDRHVRVEGVALEDHGDVTVLGRDVVDHAVADLQGPGRDLLEPGDHAQAGRLAAAGGAHQDHELAVVDRQVHVVDGGHVAELLGDVIEGHGRHGAASHSAKPAGAGSCIWSPQAAPGRAPYATTGPGSAHRTPRPGRQAAAVSRSVTASIVTRTVRDAPAAGGGGQAKTRQLPWCIRSAPASDRETVSMDAPGDRGGRFGPRGHDKTESRLPKRSRVASRSRPPRRTGRGCPGPVRRRRPGCRRRPTGSATTPGTGVASRRPLERPDGDRDVERQAGGARRSTVTT